MLLYFHLHSKKKKSAPKANTAFLSKQQNSNTLIKFDVDGTNGSLVLGVSIDINRDTIICLKEPKLVFKYFVYKCTIKVMLEYIWELYAKINKQDNNQRTPLHTYSSIAGRYSASETGDKLASDMINKK